MKNLKTVIKDLLLKSTGYEVRSHNPDAYEYDGLRTVHGHQFMENSHFKAAVARGDQAAGANYNIYWRIHIALWAAKTVSALDGDYIECGVNFGVVSSAIMHRLNWDSLGKHFYLFDTFEGQHEAYVSAEEEQKRGTITKNRKFLETGSAASLNDAVNNFSEWGNVEIVKGPVPDTFKEVSIEKLAFAHIDMNCVMPEVEAFHFIFPRLSSGGMILMDDYCHHNCELQTDALNNVASEYGASICSLPTGQGLLVKSN